MSSGKIEVMGLFSWLRALARRKPAEERKANGVVLDENVGPPDANTAIPPEHTGPGAGPDWPYVWNALIDASAHVGRAEELLSDERAFFDFEDITRAAGQLRERISRAYGLMCTAPWLEGLEFEAGDDLDTVRRMVDIQRAEIIDRDLAAMRRTPASDAPTWSIDYRTHGGFIATSQPGDGTRPWKFWGAAPTAGSAVQTLSWCFLDQPPVIVFDPPLPEMPRPLATIGPDSDISPEGPRVGVLLDQRGRTYDDHIAACVAARDLLISRGDVKGHLAERADELNATDPQLYELDILDPIGSPLNHDHGGFASTVQWVPTHLVVATNNRIWGDFGGHRDDAPLDIVGGLLTSDLDAFTYELFIDEISLVRAPGWVGPLYRIGGNGNHRIHTARMLNLPWLAAAVEVESIATSWDMLGLIAEDPHNPATLRQPLEQRLHERSVLVAGLIRRGIIDGELVGEGHQPTLHCRRLPAAWLLRAPQDATTVNAIYESRYPGALAQLGIPVSFGTDPAAWTQWLSSPEHTGPPA